MNYFTLFERFCFPPYTWHRLMYRVVILYKHTKTELLCSRKHEIIIVSLVLLRQINDSQNVDNTEESFSLFFHTLHQETLNPST